MTTESLFARYHLQCLLHRAYHKSVTNWICLTSTRRNLASLCISRVKHFLYLDRFSQSRKLTWKGHLHSYYVLNNDAVLSHINLVRCMSIIQYIDNSNTEWSLPKWIPTWNKIVRHESIYFSFRWRTNIQVEYTKYRNLLYFVIYLLYTKYRNSYILIGEMIFWVMRMLMIGLFMELAVCQIFQRFIVVLANLMVDILTVKEKSFQSKNLSVSECR